MIGGWQTDGERAHVALTRAREQTNIYVSKENLGNQGMNPDAIDRLAEKIEQSKAQQASIAHEPIATDRTTGRDLAHTNEPEAQNTNSGNHEREGDRKRAPRFLDYFFFFDRVEEGLYLDLTGRAIWGIGNPLGAYGRIPCVCC